MTPTMTPQDEREAASLSDCPLCGRQPRRNGRGGVGGVLCSGDNATIGMIHRFQTYGADQAEADAAWNRAALRQPGAEYRRAVEDAARVADRSVAYFRDLAVANGASEEGSLAAQIACDDLATAIRALTDAKEVGGG